MSSGQAAARPLCSAITWPVHPQMGGTLLRCYSVCDAQCHGDLWAEGTAVLGAGKKWLPEPRGWIWVTRPIAAISATLGGTRGNYRRGAPLSAARSLAAPIGTGRDHAASWGRRPRGNREG